MLSLCNITNTVNVTQRTFEIVQKSRSREQGDIDNYNNYYIDKNARRLRARASPETSTCEVPSDVQKVAADFVYDNGVVEVSLLHI